MIKRVLICGATGFIGRNLLDYYFKKDQYNIRATHFTRSPPSGYTDVEWVHCDLRDPTCVKSVLKEVDIVLQFAATTSGAKDIISTPHVHIADNAVMNSLLLREAFEQGVEHFIFPSCTNMYQKSHSALRESDFNASDEIPSFYFGCAHTKVYIENMCKFYANLGRTKHTVIRHSNVYGPYDKYDLEKSHVFGATITKVMTSSSGNIVVWGAGEEARDLLYVKDLVRFIDAAIDKQSENFELFNVGLGRAIKIKDLVKKIIECSCRDLEVIYDLSKPTIPTSLFLDCSYAKEKLGWQPFHTLEEGIFESIGWFEKNMKQG